MVDWWTWDQSRRDWIGTLTRWVYWSLITEAVWTIVQACQEGSTPNPLTKRPRVVWEGAGKHWHSWIIFSLFLSLSLDKDPTQLLHLGSKNQAGPPPWFCEIASQHLEQTCGCTHSPGTCLFRLSCFPLQFFSSMVEWILQVLLLKKKCYFSYFQVPQGASHCCLHWY